MKSQYQKDGFWSRGRQTATYDNAIGKILWAHIQERGEALAATDGLLEMPRTAVDSLGKGLGINVLEAIRDVLGFGKRVQDPRRIVSGDVVDDGRQQALAEIARGSWQHHCSRQHC